jgi:hypothetical protein
MSKGGPERSPGLQPFSYAEAAKGRTNPSPASQQGVENPKGSATTVEERRPSTDSSPITNGLETSQSITNQEAGSHKNDSITESEVAQPPDDPENTSTTASTITSSALQTKTTNEPKYHASGTSSPSFGTASTSTLPKEDEISITPNGSSDSTWDKQSQVSTSVEKATQTNEPSQEKASEGWGDNSTSGSRELKEAPPPAVNFWTQRKAAQDAKAKANVKATPTPVALPNATKSGSPNLQPTSEDPTPDQAKLGSKKRLSVPAKAGEDNSNVQRQDRRRATDSNKPRDEGTISLSPPYCSTDTLQDLGSQASGLVVLLTKRRAQQSLILPHVLVMRNCGQLPTLLKME